MDAARTPSMESVLGALTVERLLDLGRAFGLGIRGARDPKTKIVSQLGERLGERLPDVLAELGRDELRAVCRAHELDDSPRERQRLLQAIAKAADVELSVRSEPRAYDHDGIPKPGQVLAARGRQWLVESAEPGACGDSPLLRLACLDDDAPGRRLDLLWDLEVGARVVSPEVSGLGNIERLDPVTHFGAYLHALRWSTVSAADANRFQAPFRAGIKLMAHQLIPLMKALELPRANLFIADDVGLGKTIEAGLVLQELILRQQAGFVLVVCPASVCLQWRDEMMRRFGLRFEVMTRQFIARRRRERGFGVNPWSTHNRFIISYPLIRRPDYRDPLIDFLGDRAEKGLLIADEAHVIAPSSASKYATDSDTTITMRGLAPKFDNRLFLSATPHNGHSNSFSALLEILDPIRFTRGVPISSTKALEPVMVRRLKRDLRQLGVERFPRRMLVQVSLEHGENGWTASERRYDAETGDQEDPTVLAKGLDAADTELQLSKMLARYTELCAPGKGRGRLAFVRLQQRLLSSPEAFARTLKHHVEAVDKAGGVEVVEQPARPLFADDPEAYGVDDEAADVEDEFAVRELSRSLPSRTEEAEKLLKDMRALAERARGKPDAKVRALLAWMRDHLCPAIGLGSKSKAKKKWSDRRVILFTEYGATKRYLIDLLTLAIEHTDDAEHRIRVFHGGMGDEGRDEVQRAFNAAPKDDPVRILVATDAAREGVNLQAHCADLFHIDVPWNPSRLEQRNGRIDRTLQPADEVRCHYFVYPQRREDRVLETLVRKIHVVKRELGSMGAVLLDEMERTLDPGIDDRSEKKLDAIGLDAKAEASEAELEAQRKDLAALEAEVHRAGQRLDRSRKALEVSPDALRGVVEVGLKLSGAEGLRPLSQAGDRRPAFELPELDRSWEQTLDTLRPPRGRTEKFWDWRRKSPRPVTFEPLERLTSDAEQLHLAHPLVRRILDRFLAQGYGAHDLSRVCGVVIPKESVARVVAYARLSLFGHGAARLHDEILTVVAPWPDAPEEATPYKDDATAAKARESIESTFALGSAAPPKPVVAKIVAAAPPLYSTLWANLEAEADARAVDAKTGLARRARKESDELRELLKRQRTAIERAQAHLRQHTLFEVRDKTQKRQVDLDLEHMDGRLGRIDDELRDEPAAIEALYEVQMTRLSPLGLVVAWPEAMT